MRLRRIAVLAFALVVPARLAADEKKQGLFDGNAPGAGGVSNPPAVPEPGYAVIVAIAGARGLLRRGRWG